MNSTTKVPTSFWVLMVLALIWNLMGVMAYLTEAFMSPDTLAAMSEDIRNAYETRPAYVTAAFALAVFGGFFGCLLMLLKKAFAGILFYISFISIIVQMYYSFFVIDSMAMFGPGAAIMPSMVLIIGFLLLVYSKKAKTKGWIA